MVYNKFIYGQENGHDTIDHIGKEDHGMKERFYRFMQGRYGQDAFSRFLLGITGLCLLFNVLLHNRFLGVLAWALLIYTYYRIFSKNHSARYEENQRYLQGTAKARYWADQQKKLWQERRYHHIYRNAGRRSGFPEEKAGLWSAVQSVSMSFRKGVK